MSDRLRIHNTGNSAYTTTRTLMTVQLTVRRAPIRSDIYRTSPSAPGAEAPNSLT